MDIFDITGLSAPADEVDIDRLTEELERLKSQEGVTIQQVGHGPGIKHQAQVRPRPVHQPSWGGRLEAEPIEQEQVEGVERFRCGKA